MEFLNAINQFTNITTTACQFNDITTALYVFQWLCLLIKPNKAIEMHTASYPLLTQG